jgi:hypothetical protein
MYIKAGNDQKKPRGSGAILEGLVVGFPDGVYLSDTFCKEIDRQQ